MEGIITTRKILLHCCVRVMRNRVGKSIKKHEKSTKTTKMHEGCDLTKKHEKHEKHQKHEGEGQLSGFMITPNLCLVVVRNNVSQLFFLCDLNDVR